MHENPYADGNPWSQMLWQPKYKGKVAILDDYREGISLGPDEERDLQPEHHRPTQIALSGRRCRICPA